MPVRPALCLSLLLGVAGCSAGTSSHDEPTKLFTGAEDLLQRTGSMKTPEFVQAFYDLNGDGRMERIIYIIDACSCGSGGCDLMVLTPRDGRFAQVADISIGHPPIEVLRTTQNGWRDLSVTLRDADQNGPYTYRAALSFDGQSYPCNPSVAPARRHNDPAFATLFGTNVFQERQARTCVAGESDRLSNMSATSVLSASSKMVTGSEMTRSRGSGVSMMGRMAMAGS